MILGGLWRDKDSKVLIRLCAPLTASMSKDGLCQLRAKIEFVKGGPDLPLSMYVSVIPKCKETLGLTSWKVNVDEDGVHTSEIQAVLNWGK